VNFNEKIIKLNEGNDKKIIIVLRVKILLGSLNFNLNCG